jgi:Uma2 family endonuclease
MPNKRATLDDLMREEFQSELIDGRIVRVGPAAYLPGRVAGEIQFSLHEHAKACERGKAYGSKLVYAVPRLSSGRESFSPDVSFYSGPLPANRMSYIRRPPTFAVEVRNQDDYALDADRRYADKRADYFEAGTLVVWDVDALAGTITSYRPGQPPVVFRRGDVADAEPAVPGWRIAVDEAFDV